MQTGVPIVKYLVYFHCRCEEKKHEIFVQFCSSHPFGTTVLNVVDSDDLDVVKPNASVKERICMIYVKCVLVFVTV